MRFEVECRHGEKFVCRWDSGRGEVVMALTGPFTTMSVEQFKHLQKSIGVMVEYLEGRKGDE